MADNCYVPTTPTNIGDTPEYCASRLPCGVCLILGRECPKCGYTITPTWTGGITTQAGTETAGGYATYDTKTGQMKVINNG